MKTATFSDGCLNEDEFHLVKIGKYALRIWIASVFKCFLFSLISSKCYAEFSLFHDVFTSIFHPHNESITISFVCAGFTQIVTTCMYKNNFGLTSNEIIPPR